MWEIKTPPAEVKIVLIKKCMGALMMLLYASSTNTVVVNFSSQFKSDKHTKINNLQELNNWKSEPN